MTPADISRASGSCANTMGRTDMKRIAIFSLLLWSVWRFWPPPDPIIVEHSLGEYLGYDDWVETCPAPRHLTEDEWKAFVKTWQQSGGRESDCRTCEKTKEMALFGRFLTCQKTYHYQPDPFTG